MTSEWCNRKSTDLGSDTNLPQHAPVIQVTLTHRVKKDDSVMPVPMWHSVHTCPIHVPT